MTRTEIIRFCGIYVPLMLCLFAGIRQRSQPRIFIGCLLGTLWTVPTLLALAHLNGVAQWWSFSGADITFAGMPIELYFGWILLWGVLPQFVPVKLPVAGTVLGFVALDLLAMPACRPLVQLHAHWLIGEAVAVLLVLLPALCLGRWTISTSHLCARASLQLILSCLIFLYFLPELAFALHPSSAWQPLLSMRGWSRQIALQCIAMLALPGVGAVMEFAQRGHGTPIPYDPPSRLVVSGIYRYFANPMQLSCFLVALAWSLLLWNPWLLFVPFICVIYSIGIARWSEAQDLRQRFGSAWQDYRAEVHDWLPRWRPYHAGAPAKLYIAFSCGPCTELRHWLEARNPIGLQILPAESLPFRSIRRLRYDPSDQNSAEEGIRALGRALEHISFAWAIAGTALRLPLIWQFVQLVMDASGFGPQELAACTVGPDIPGLLDKSSGQENVVDNQTLHM
ncbi:methyltransferase family protein [Acidicapsa dinghuensis]|uniref:Methyltransferase family protein n=1 Tax=Acidicapsa dinghuensis TaxID=2218256 RepID=A0ABW1EGV9_9BACT|nr:isoprenylcysteine carboxylmethyltransferase family protein [Acidicapsa dinghuensis]